MKLPPPPPPLTQGQRVAVFFVNVSLAWLCFFLATDEAIPAGSGASVWFLALTAHWLLTLLDAPFFLPPRDALGMSIGTVLLVAPIDLSSAAFQGPLVVATRATHLVAVLVAALSAFAVFRISTIAGGVAYRLSEILGRSEVLLSPAVAVSAIGFYPNRPGWTAGVLTLWVVAVVVRPLERMIQIASFITRTRAGHTDSLSVGSLLRVDDPDLVRVALKSPAISWESNVVHAVRFPNGKSRLVLPLFVQSQNEELIGTGLCCDGLEPPASDNAVGSVHAVDDVALRSRVISTLSGDSGVDAVVGIVVEGSSISELRFQVVRGSALEEGTVIYTMVLSHKVYYQILDADTSEDSFQQRPLGVHIARAAQLGTYDATLGFRKFPWLPEMNKPQFVLPAAQGVVPPPGAGTIAVGLVPHTSFSVTARLKDLIEYHTAVLGVTGTGNTELTLDIIRHALADGCKVFCVDLTGEYKTRFANCSPEQIGLSLDEGSKLAELLFAVETGTYGAPGEKKALKEFVDGIRPQVKAQIETFLEKDGASLATIELTEITNTKATLRTTELYLSAIMDWARKHRKARRILIVLEETHTIIPEAYASGFDSETQWVVGRIGQISLQGRKYGVGLLLVSQRTALVSKTVLSQCNTFFTHSLVDKTSLDFLGGMVGPEHVRVLPNLRFLDFVAHGKAVNSERPLLARRTFDAQKLAQDEALNVQLND